MGWFRESLVTAAVVAVLLGAGMMFEEIQQGLLNSLLIKEVQIPNRSFSASHVEWHADGKQLMLQARGGRDGPAISVSIHPLEGEGYLPQWSETLRGSISHATFSADGVSAIVATITGELWWIDVETSAATELMKVPSTAHFVTTAATQDASLIAAATMQGDVYLFEPRLGKSRMLSQSFSETVTRLRFSRDDRRLMITSPTGTIEIWDTSSHELLYQFRCDGAQVAAAAFLPDGKRVIKLSNSHSIEVTDIETQSVLWDGARDTIRSFGVTSIDVCPRGEIAVWSGGDGCRIVIWDLCNQRMIREIQQPSVIFDLRISPDGTHLAVVGNERLVRIYDLTTGEQSHRIDLQQVLNSMANL